MKEFMENESGVHLMVSEFSLCGDAFDIGAVDDEISSMRHTEKKTVTCNECARIISLCKGVRVAEEAKDKRE